MTQIVDHGKWVRYQPDMLPEHAPPTTLFARRESDGVDWYVYSRDSKNFSPDTVKFTVLWQDMHNGYTVGAAARDPTQLFPAGALLREIIDYHGGSDPQVELSERLYNPDTNKLHDRPTLPTFDFQSVLDRLAAIEAKLGGTP